MRVLPPVVVVVLTVVCARLAFDAARAAWALDAAGEYLAAGLLALCCVALLGAIAWLFRPMWVGLAKGRSHGA